MVSGASAVGQELANAGRQDRYSYLFAVLASPVRIRAGVTGGGGASFISATPTRHGIESDRAFKVHQYVGRTGRHNFLCAQRFARERPFPNGGREGVCPFPPFRCVDTRGMEGRALASCTCTALLRLSARRIRHR